MGVGHTIISGSWLLPSEQNPPISRDMFVGVCTAAAAKRGYKGEVSLMDYFVML